MGGIIMRPTEELKKEHEAIKLMIRIMGSVSARLESGKEVDPNHLESILEFIKVFADKCHHAKEEDLLFPAMEKAGIPREGGPVGVMLLEHDEGRGFVKAMGDGIALYTKGDLSAGSKIAENARNYMVLLSQHIDKEDNILYPMADMRIPEADQTELEKEFEKVEIEKIGRGKHEEFHQLLHKLKEEYLKEE
jgi:hemerythrin-like domain-containing protein